MKQRIEIAKIPSSADLRARRLGATRATLAAACLDDDLGDYRELLGSLSSEFDLDDIALAAIKWHTWPPRATQAKSRSPGRASRSGAGKALGIAGGTRAAVIVTAARSPYEGAASTRARDEVRGPRPGKQRIFISAGREAGIRPQDVVGAIANETDLTGSQIGPIDIAGRFTTVDVPAEAAKDVIAALSRTRLKGKRVKAARTATSEERRSRRPRRTMMRRP